MTKKWVSTDAGRHLRGRRKVNTEPEVALRRQFHRAGARFRLHVRLAKGCTPDILMPGRRLAVFVDGCWWHSCPRHGRTMPFTGPNAQLWSEKMRRNLERDERSTALAEEVGWTVVRVWECEVREDAEAVAARTLGQGPASYSARRVKP
jgi:DNA mismatch endonuclease (patch repair protein)